MSAREQLVDLALGVAPVAFESLGEPAQHHQPLSRPSRHLAELLPSQEAREGRRLVRSQRVTTSPEAADRTAASRILMTSRACSAVTSSGAPSFRCAETLV